MSRRNQHFPKHRSLLAAEIVVRGLDQLRLCIVQIQSHAVFSDKGWIGVHRLNHMSMRLAGTDKAGIVVSDTERIGALPGSFGAVHDSHRSNLFICEFRCRVPQICFFAFLRLGRQTIRHALQNPVERDVLSNGPLVRIIAKRLVAVLIASRCRFMTGTEIGVPTFNGRINMSALHAARLTKISGRSVSRGMLILFSMSTAIGAVTGLAPLTRERAVGSGMPSRSASSDCEIPCSSQYRSSGSQRFFLFTIRSESWN